METTGEMTNTSHTYRNALRRHIICIPEPFVSKYTILSLCQIRDWTKIRKKPKDNRSSLPRRTYLIQRTMFLDRMAVPRGILPALN